jgi:hypothetical protein
VIPTASAGASARVQLGLRLRNEANLTGRCACGAVREMFELDQDGTMRPVLGHEPGRLYYTRFRHEDDCPAIDPELERAVERGEVSDPAGDLFTRLLGGEAAS